MPTSAMGESRQSSPREDLASGAEGNGYRLLGSQRSPVEGARTLSEAYREIVGGGNVEPIRKRGTRWPVDAEIPAQWIHDGYALREKHKLPRIDLELEATKFVLHFTSTNRNAAKILWHRTWLNWCLNSRGGKVQETPAKSAKHDIIEQSRARAKLAARGIRAALLDRADLERGVREGILTEEQAKRFGF